MTSVIAFHSNQLSVRGTEVALYDYAHYFEKLYSGRSIIITPKISQGHDARAASRFAQRFPVFPYESKDELDSILNREKVELLYSIKAGFKDGPETKVCRSVVHAVFPHFEPHGDVYAYISGWLSTEMQALNKDSSLMPYVPHIVTLKDEEGDLRSGLKIPSEAIVFGRYGGPESFDIPFVRELLSLIVSRRPDIYFLFANTPAFCEVHPQIIHLDAFCDESLHARHRGETFGLSVAEFAVRNRPVFTWKGSYEKAHIEYLGERAILYETVEDLALSLLSFVPHKSNGKCLYTEFTAENVMKKFMQVFS
jgi:hypothetical protein